MPRNPKDKCNNTWENLYGTTASGNLPQYKVGYCIEDIIDLTSIHNSGLSWVRVSDFHFYHIKCPYSTESFTHYVRNLDRASTDYWKVYELSQSELAPHTATSGIMIRYNKGSKYGWLCVDPACPYFINTGMRYFYR